MVVTVKVMRLRYAGTCVCGAAVPAGAMAGWNSAARQVICARCLDASTDSEVNEPAAFAPTPVEANPGQERAELAQSNAGASLTQEYERRMARRDERVRARLPRLGPLLLAVFDESQSTKAFKQGAEGERRAVKRLLDSSGEGVHFLVNRRLGSGRRDGDIDVLAISPAGVWIIDVKRYADAKVRTEKTGGLFSPRTEHLLIRGRNADKLLEGMGKQVDAVSSALGSDASWEAVPLLPVLCFVDADLPLVGRLAARGVRIVGPKSLARDIRESGGPVAPAMVELVATHLDAALPNA